MKAICLRKRTKPPELLLEEIPRPEITADQVLIRVHAAGVTPTELQWMPTWNTMQGAPRSLPIVPGHEFSGEVSEIGAKISGVSLGELVYGLNDWFGNGAQAEYCIAAPGSIAPKPSSAEHLAAAVTPISALTAWQALLDRGQIRAGHRVLIHGAAGGVGSFAVQLARLHEAHIIATASAHNMGFVQTLGADEVVDYREQDFEKIIRDVDLVLDTVGGETLEKSWGVLKSGGRLVTIAASEEGAHDQRTKDAFFIVEPKREQLIEIAKLMDSGKLRPVIGGTYSITQAREAYETKPPRGKNVIEL